MSGWQILGLVLIVLFLIGQVRVGVGAEYDQDGLTVRASLGWLKIKVFPLPKKEGTKKKKKPKKKKKDRKQKGKAAKKKAPAVSAKQPAASASVPARPEEQNTGTSAAAPTAATSAKTELVSQESVPEENTDEKAEKSLGEKIGGGLDLAKQFVPLALEAAGCFWKKLVVDELELCLTVGGPDPADAAMLYGQANAALAALWQPLTEAFHVKDGHAQTRIDFDAPGMTLYGKAALSLKIGQILWLAVYFGCKALARFMKYRNIREAKQEDRKAV